MANPIPAALREPVTDLESGKAWLRALVAAGLVFHLEDSPESIISGATGAPLFLPEDVPTIRAAVDALYALDWHPPGLTPETGGRYYCPIGYMLTLEEPSDPESLLPAPFESGSQSYDLWTLPPGFRIVDAERCASYTYGAPGRFRLFRDGVQLSAHDSPDAANAAVASAA